MQTKKTLHTSESSGSFLGFSISTEYIGKSFFAYKVNGTRNTLAELGEYLETKYLQFKIFFKKTHHTSRLYRDVRLNTKITYFMAQCNILKGFQL